MTLGGDTSWFNLGEQRGWKYFLIYYLKPGRDSGRVLDLKLPSWGFRNRGSHQGSGTTSLRRAFGNAKWGNLVSHHTVGVGMRNWEKEGKMPARFGTGAPNKESSYWDVSLWETHMAFPGSSRLGRLCILEFKYGVLPLSSPVRAQSFELCLSGAGTAQN